MFGQRRSAALQGYTATASAISVRGLGKKIFRRSTSPGADGPINSASNFSCCRQARIASGEGGGNFRAASSNLSRCETLKMKSAIHTAARAVHVRRQGKINSRQSLFEPPRHKDTKLSCPPPQYVHGIVEDETGRLIVGGKSLTFIDGDSVTPVQSWGKSARSQIKSLLYTRQRHLIVGTVDGAFEMDGERFRRLLFPKDDIESLCQSGDGAIWAGTVSAGLWRLKDGQASRVGFREWSIARTILAMTTDARGRLWVGTQRGLSRIEETHVHFVGSPALDVDRETLAVTADGDVNLVNSGVFRIENRKLRPLAFPIPRNTRILDALYSKDRSVWLGTAGLGVYRVDPSGRVTQYSTQSHLKLSTDYPRGIVKGTHGDIWVATEFGVNLIRRGSVELLSASDGLPSRAVRTLFLDRQGCMWIGTDAGPAVSCNGALVQNRATSVLNGEEIWAIAQDESGTMWFGTQNNGIYAVGDSDVRHLTTANGLPSNDICGLIVDRTGNLWVPPSIRSFRSPPRLPPRNAGKGIPSSPAILCSAQRRREGDQIHARQNLRAQRSTLAGRTVCDGSRCGVH